MDDHGFRYSWNMLPTGANKGRRWLKGLGGCALLGGVYGATVGAAIGAVPVAADVIGIAAAFGALAFGMPGAGYGFFFGLINRVRFARLFVGFFAALGGALLGAFAATMILLALGAILGMIGGWLVARAVLALRHGVLRRLLAGVVGAAAGMFLGAFLWAVRLNEQAALAGAVWGLGIGVIAGPLLLLAFLAALRAFLPAPPRNDDGVIDVTFQPEEPPSLPRQE